MSSRTSLERGETCGSRYQYGRDPVHASTRRCARLDGSFRALVLGPLDLRQLRHADQRVLGLLEQHHRVRQRAHSLEYRVEHVYAHQPALILRIVVEVLMPEEMIDHDKVAFFPAMMLSLVGSGAEETVAVSLDHVEPGLAGMPVQRLGLSGSELDHHLGDAGSLVADRTIDQKLGSRTSRRRKDLDLV